MKKENIKKGAFFVIDANTKDVFQITDIKYNTAVVNKVLSSSILTFPVEFLIEACTELHWKDGIRLWDKYKKLHPEANEVLNDLENCFGLDRDGELSKFMSYTFLEINDFGY